MSGVFPVLSISRHRITVDGEGVTTLVGLAGCPLDCRYCINRKLLRDVKPRPMTPEELWKKLEIDYCYFVATGGGVTFGGGESLLHTEAIAEFKRLLPEGVRITAETSLNVPAAALLMALESVDSFIIDVKDVDADVYSAYTGVSNERTLENLRLLAERGMQESCHIRVPLIPGYNDAEEAERSEAFVRSLGFENIERFEYIIKIKDDAEKPS